MKIIRVFNLTYTQNSFYSDLVDPTIISVQNVFALKSKFILGETIWILELQSVLISQIKELFRAIRAPGFPFIEWLFAERMVLGMISVFGLNL